MVAEPGRGLPQAHSAWEPPPVCSRALWWGFRARDVPEGRGDAARGAAYGLQDRADADQTCMASHVPGSRGPLRDSEPGYEEGIAQLWEVR